MHGECSVPLLQGDDKYLAGGVLGHDANAIVATLVLASPRPRFAMKQSAPEDRLDLDQV